MAAFARRPFLRAARARLAKRAARIALAASIACALFAARAHAESTSLDANVVWARGARVYIASRDTAAIAAGDRLTFLDHNRSIAHGTVVRVDALGLCMATLDSSSLDPVKHRERLRVRIERPALPAVTMLRIGAPSRSRPCLWFGCGSNSIHAGVPDSGYRSEALGDHLMRMVRDTELIAHGAWPDTLMIREFDEPGDEEIALERDELDVALFWPGELSSHIRDQPRWMMGRYGVLKRGLVAALSPKTGSFHAADARLDPALSALDRDLFRGDLAAWDTNAPLSASDSPLRADPSRSRRFEVDPACPGHITLERFLNRMPGVSAASADAIRVFYLDAPPAFADSVALAAADYVRHGAFPASLRARAGSLNAAIEHSSGSASPTRDPIQRMLADSLGVVPLYSIRCPVLCVPRSERIVDRLGADAFVALLNCERVARP